MIQAYAYNEADEKKLHDRLLEDTRTALDIALQALREYGALNQEALVTLAAAILGRMPR